MNQFNSIKLSELGATITGKTPSSKHPEDFGVETLFVTPSDNFNGKYISETKRLLSSLGVEKLKKKLLPPNSILVTCIGSAMGKVAINTHEAISNQQINTLIVKNSFDVDYVYYLLKNNYSALRNAASGSTALPLLNKSDFDSLNFRIHSSDYERKRIGRVLSSLDNKIEINHKINAELESMAKLIYDYWFVQFDFPDENGKPYKSSGGKMVYNERLKREIPEGWDVDYLSSYIAKDKSGDWGKEAEQGNYTLNVNCIRGADINGIKGQGDLKSPVRYILPKNSHKIIESGDMIVEISGGSPTQSTARAAYINDGVLNRFNTPLISSNFCRVITLNQPKWIYSFFQEWQFLYDADFFFGWEGKTSGIKNFLFEQFLENYKTAIPPELLLNKYYETVCDNYNKVQTNLLENQKLAELRDWLLPMLMNGQVTIKD